MPRMRLAALAGVALCVSSLAGCQAGSSSGTPTERLASAPPMSTGPAASDAPVPATDPVAGVVTHVDSQGLDAVTGFTLRTPDGHTYQFVIGQVQNGTEFPPGHLVEHAATSEPILVTFAAQGSELLATRLEDAPAAATSAPSPS